MHSHKPKVLVAEDHADTRELYVYVLEQSNYEVVTADGVNDALAQLKNQKFDLFLLDSRLSDGSGLALCRTIRKSDGATPILFCSGLAYEKDKEEAFNAGAQDYLVKPLNLNKLCEKVAQLIASSRTAPLSIVQAKANGRGSGDLPVANVSV